jgi:polysaccharide export outer membrane protein
MRFPFHETRRRPTRWRWVGPGLTAVLLAACASPGALPPPQPAPGQREPYVIGPPDRLAIRVWKNPELSVNVQVRSDGMISMPLLDDVQAEGLTPEELKEVITQALSEYVATPDVTVIVESMPSKAVFVIGDGIARRGPVILNREMRILDLLANQGGFTQFAQRDDIRILRRQEDGSLVQYRFDFDAYLSGAAPDTNIVLEPGDTIVVRE